MVYHNNTLCIEAGWLIENGVMSRAGYQNLRNRKHINVVRRASRNTPALVAYESIPGRFRADIAAKLGGDPYMQARYNILEEHIVMSAEAGVFFENYKLADGRRLPPKTRTEYYNNAILLEAIHRLVVTKVARKKLSGGPVTRIWNRISEAVQGLDRTQYPHQLPENPARLRDKYNLYRKEGYESLIHKNFMNKHAAKIDDEVKESLVVELLADPRNLDNEQVARLYNQIAEQMGWRRISGRTVALRRDKYNLEIHPGRRGVTDAYNTRLMQAKRSAPTRPLYYWTLDGWDVELLYQKTEKGVTTYHHRPTVVIVLDPCLRYPVGFAVGTHETPELIKAALRNAAQHTAQLFGSMHRAHQIQSDRYAFKTLEPLYAMMACKVTPARAKNAKSKVIEPYFGRLNRTYCQMMPNWSGFGITSDRDKQPNSEFLNRYKQNFPDYEGVCLMVAMIVEKERQAKKEEYVKLWETLPAADRIELPYENYLYYFGTGTGRTNLLQPDGLNITIKGLKRTYDSFDIGFRKHASVNWRILYDPDDVSRVLALNGDDTLRFVLEEKHIQPMALRERTDGDAEALRRVNDFNRDAVSYVTGFRAETGSNVQELFAQNPQLDGTLARLILTDSRGQHKNRRNVGRGPDDGRAIEAQAAGQPAGTDGSDGSDIYDMM